MPTYKTTLFVEAADGGFSETMYLTVTDVSAALKRVQTYLPFRAKVLASGDADGGLGKIVGYRIQNVANPNDFEIVDKIFPGIFKPSDRPSGADMPWTGIVCQFIGSGGRRRSFTLRGIPDSAVKNTYKGVNFLADFGNAMNSWRKALLDHDFQIQTINKTDPTLLKTIVAVLPGPGGLGITTSAPHGLVSGDLVRFYKVKSRPTLTGQHRIIVAANDNFVIPNINLGVVDFDYGSVRKVTYTTEDIEEVLFKRKGSRKAGRPFFLLRGRR